MSTLSTLCEPDGSLVVLCLCDDGRLTYRQPVTLAPYQGDISELSECTPSKDVYVLNGQSNARPQFFDAVNAAADDLGKPYASAHFWAGGNQLRNWIDENGVKTTHWQPMIDAYVAVLNQCKATGQSINKIHMVYFQGEADTANSDTQDALNSGQPSIFIDKLTNFINCFTDEMQNRCGIKPVFSIALLGFDQTHPTFISVTNLTAASVSLIRSEIQQVADSFPCAETFETEDLARRDHVHLNYFPTEGLAMKTAADRALAYF